MNIQLPTLQTQRLLLRAFEIADAPIVQSYCNDHAIYDMTLNIPHPYLIADAESWISSHEEALQQRRQANFALVVRHTNILVGTVGLTIKPPLNHAEMGYWIGKPHWNNGYASEGAMAVLQFGFEVLLLDRIFACHFAKNMASGRVMQNIGLRYEEFSPKCAQKDGLLIDTYLYGLNKTDYQHQ